MENLQQTAHGLLDCWVNSLAAGLGLFVCDNLLFETPPIERTNRPGAGTYRIVYIIDDERQRRPRQGVYE